jgi:organic radical activating enzyme
MNSWTLSELRAWRRHDQRHDLILYGAGDLGKLALEALRRAGIRVDAFCDDSPAKQGTLWRDAPIISFAELARRDRAARILISMNYLSPALRELTKLGFEDIGNCVGVFDSAMLTDVDVGVHALEIDRKIDWHRRECAKAIDETALNIKYIDVVVTEKCSLRCIDCSNLMQYYKKPRHADFDGIIGDLHNIMNSVDGVDEIRLLGGEPFINKQFGDILRRINVYRNIRHIIVYTNATVLPDATALTALADARVTVNITDYGALSRKCDELINLLKRSGVAYLVKQPNWTDSGRIRPQQKSHEELDQQFQRCCVNDILTLLNGRIYRCPFAANLANLDVAPAHASEIVEVVDDWPAMRKALRSLYLRPERLTACTYCSGRDYTTPKIPAAIQAPRPLPIPPPLQSEVDR